MFNVGPWELMVLAIVGIVVIGPEKLPGLARDAAQMLRTLRELATGARQQLKDELGPEFADIDLRNLNPRTAVSRVIFGDEDLSTMDPRTAMRSAFFGDADLKAADPRGVLRETRESLSGLGSVNGNSAAANGVNGHSDGPVSFDKPVARPDVARSRPRPRPVPRTNYGDDIT
ncbi:MAG: sec-independent translocase [Jatrophihabitans sp.]